MVHSYMDLKVKGLECMAASGSRVRVTGLVLVFKSASFALKQVPTCIRKSKTIPSINELGFYIGYLYKWF